MSRFTLKSLRNEQIMLVSRFDPAIDWPRMQREHNLYFDHAPDGGVLYDAAKHSNKVLCCPGETPLKFFVHPPTAKEYLLSYELAGLEADDDSGVQYFGAGGGPKFAPGNGVLWGMTSSLEHLALFCIDHVEGIDFNGQFREKTGYGVARMSKAALEALAPVDSNNTPRPDLFLPVLIEIGNAVKQGDGEVGNSSSASGPPTSGPTSSNSVNLPTTAPAAEIQK